MATRISLCKCMLLSHMRQHGCRAAAYDARVCEGAAPHADSAGAAGEAPQAQVDSARSSSGCPFHKHSERTARTHGSHTSLSHKHDKSTNCDGAARRAADVEPEQVAAGEAPREREREAAGPAADVDRQRPRRVGEHGCPVRRRQRHLQLRLERVDMLARAHGLRLARRRHQRRQPQSRCAVWVWRDTPLQLLLLSYLEKNTP